jgi:hypothetical protein
VVLGFRLLPAIFDLAVAPLMKLGGLSRRPLAAYPGTVLEPNPAGEAEHGFWGRLGGRTVQTEAVSPADDQGSTSLPDPKPTNLPSANPPQPAAAGQSA